MYPIIHVFGKDLGLYGICAAVGILLSGFLAVKLAKKFNIELEDTILAYLAALGGGFIIAHLLYGITNTSNIISFISDNPSLSFWEYFTQIANYFGGMVFYGGFIGGVIGIYIFTKFYKPLKGKGMDMIDIFSVVFPLFHVFGRIGCFLGGCCYGIESEFGFLVENNTINPSINGVTRFPVQLLEAALNLIIFLIMLYLIKHNKQTHKLLFIYMIMYGIVRFSDEFLRGDTYRGFILGMSTSQFISVILIVISIISLVFIHFKNNNKKENS